MLVARFSHAIFSQESSSSFFQQDKLNKKDYSVIHLKYQIIAKKIWNFWCFIIKKNRIFGF